MTRFLATLYIGLMLAACGFHPLYGNVSTLAGGSTALDNVGIRDIPQATGQALRNALIDRFYNHGYPQNPRYELVTAVEESVRDIVIQRNDTTTRSQLVLRATYQLVDNTTRAVIDKGAIRAVSSYNILPSQYSTLVTQNDARDRNLRELADKITTRLAVVLQDKM